MTSTCLLLPAEGQREGLSVEGATLLAGTTGGAAWRTTWNLPQRVCQSWQGHLCSVGLSLGWVSLLAVAL